MTVLGSFISLKSQDKKLVLKAFFLNYYVRFITWIFPFKRAYRIAQKMGQNYSKTPIELYKLTWAVNVTGNYVFRSTCLTKAITAQILLEKHGHHPKVHIGVMKCEEFEAHAWVEISGEVVLGESEKDFIKLVDL